MGEMVFDNFTLRGGTQEELIRTVEGVKTGLIIKDKLISALEWVGENLPSSAKTLKTNLIPSNAFTVSPSFSSPSPSSDDTYVFNNYPSFYELVVKNPLSYSKTVSFYNSNDNSISNFSVDYGETFTIRLFGVNNAYETNKKNLVRVVGMRLGGSYAISAGSLISENINDFFNVKISIPSELQIISSDVINTIPYDNEKVKENYQPGLLPQSIPYTDSKPGYVPIPLDIPVDNNISTELPLTWDNVKDTVTDLPIDGAIDTPIEGDISIPSDSNPSIGSFWGWLLDILKAILNAIKAIVTFLTTFFTKLMEMLIDLIKSLFVPSDTYFTDSFNKLKNNFGNRLNYKTYTDLFDKTYSGSSIKDVVINWQGQEITIVKFSEFESFRSFFNTVVYAFFFFLLAIYNYNQLYKMLRGTDLVSSGITIGHMQGQITPNEQLKLNTVMRRSLKS